MDASLPEAFFPELSDMPLEIPCSCLNCKDCRQCQYEVCDMTYREKKELEALRKAVSLDPQNNVVHASYPEINPELGFRNNKWQAAAMGLSLKKTLNKAGIMETYNVEFKDLINRDCIKAVSPEEIVEWEANGGKVNYISHHPVLTPDKVTTHCRLVINSSLRNSGSDPSSNDNWPKGPNALKPMYGVILRF